jgi:hypothetical protein
MRRPTSLKWQKNRFRPAPSSFGIEPAQHRLKCPIFVTELGHQETFQAAVFCVECVEVIHVVVWW